MTTTHRWIRPTTITDNISGGYALLRSHALLALWQQYRVGHLSLLDMRVALGGANAIRCKPSHPTSNPRVSRVDAPSHLNMELTRATRIMVMTDTRDVRRVRSSLRRLAATGLELSLLLSKAGGAMPITLVNANDIADRPVPVPRRWLSFFARHGTAATIASGLAMLVRGAFFKAGMVHLGGTCSATWINDTFGIDERTAKSGRARLVQAGLVRLEPSPHWHRQRYGMTFVPMCPSPASERTSPPRTASEALGSPPLRKNENDSLRELRNQNGIAVKHDSFATMQAKSARNALASPFGESPTLSHVRHEDLVDPERRTRLYRDVLTRGLIGPSEAERLQFQVTIRHCLRVGTHPPALFATLARSRCWHFGSQADEEAAQRPSPDGKTTASPLSVPNGPPRATRPFQTPVDRVAPEVARNILRGLLASLKARQPAVQRTG
jgi:hypothetical protein